MKRTLQFKITVLASSDNSEPYTMSSQAKSAFAQLIELVRLIDNGNGHHDYKNVIISQNNKGQPGRVIYEEKTRQTKMD